MPNIKSSDGDPYGFVAGFGFGYFLFQAVKPGAAVEHFSYFAILANQYATLGVGRCVAGVYAYAAEHRHAQQYGQPLLNLWTPRNHYCIATFGNGERF